MYTSGTWSLITGIIFPLVKSRFLSSDMLTTQEDNLLPYFPLKHGWLDGPKPHYPQVSDLSWSVTSDFYDVLTKCYTVPRNKTLK